MTAKTATSRFVGKVPLIGTKLKTVTAGACLSSPRVISKRTTVRVVLQYLLVKSH